MSDSEEVVQGHGSQTRHQYLVRVGVSRAQKPLVLVEQHPQLTVELGLVEQLAQHGAARSHLAALGLRWREKNKCIKNEKK